MESSTRQPTTATPSRELTEVMRSNSAASFVGSFDPVTVESTVEPLVTDGGEEGLARGADVQAVINGREHIGTGSRVRFAQSGLQIALDFQAGFTGAFTPFAVIRQTRAIVDNSTQTLPDESREYAAPGDEDPLQLLLRELGERATIPGIESPAATGSSPAPDGSLSQVQIVRRLFQQLFQSGPRAQWNSYDQGTTYSLLVQHAVDLKA